MKHAGFKSILQQNLIYWLFCAFYLLAGLYLNLNFAQKEIFFWVNGRHNAVLDVAMPYITFLGDGIFFIAAIIVLFLYKIRNGLAALFAWLLLSAIVQSGKLIFFTDQPRPWNRWKDTDTVYLVEGFIPYSNNSFPSGHTASAFGLYTLLALLWQNKKLNWLLFLPALLVAYSRIYLAQHYFVDTFFGAITGIFSAFVIYYYFYCPKRSFARLQPWLDKPLLKLRR